MEVDELSSDRYNFLLGGLEMVPDGVCVMICTRIFSQPIKTVEVRSRCEVRETLIRPVPVRYPGKVRVLTTSGVLEGTRDSVKIE